MLALPRWRRCPYAVVTANPAVRPTSIRLARAQHAPALGSAVARDRAALPALITRLAGPHALNPDVLQAAVACVHERAPFAALLDVVLGSGGGAGAGKNALSTFDVRVLVTGCGRWGTLADALRVVHCATERAGEPSRAWAAVLPALLRLCASPTDVAAVLAAAPSGHAVSNASGGLPTAQSVNADGWALVRLSLAGASADVCAAVARDWAARADAAAGGDASIATNDVLSCLRTAIVEPASLALVADTLPVHGALTTAAGLRSAAAAVVAHALLRIARGRFDEAEQYLVRLVTPATPAVSPRRHGGSGVAAPMSVAGVLHASLLNAAVAAPDATVGDGDHLRGGRSLLDRHVHFMASLAARASAPGGGASSSGSSGTVPATTSVAASPSRRSFGSVETSFSPRPPASPLPAPGAVAEGSGGTSGSDAALPVRIPLRCCGSSHLRHVASAVLTASRVQEPSGASPATMDALFQHVRAAMSGDSVAALASSGGVSLGPSSACAVYVAAGTALARLRREAATAAAAGAPRVATAATATAAAVRMVDGCLDIFQLEARSRSHAAARTLPATPYYAATDSASRAWCTDAEIGALVAVAVEAGAARRGEPPLLRPAAAALALRRAIIAAAGTQDAVAPLSPVVEVTAADVAADATAAPLTHPATGQLVSAYGDASLWMLQAQLLRGADGGVVGASPATPRALRHFPPLYYDDPRSRYLAPTADGDGGWPAWMADPAATAPPGAAPPLAPAERARITARLRERGAYLTGLDGMWTAGDPADDDRSPFVSLEEAGGICAAAGTALPLLTAGGGSAVAAEPTGAGQSEDGFALWSAVRAVRSADPAVLTAALQDAMHRCASIGGGDEEGRRAVAATAGAAAAGAAAAAAAAAGAAAAAAATAPHAAVPSPYARTALLNVALSLCSEQLSRSAHGAGAAALSSESSDAGERSTGAGATGPSAHLQATHGDAVADVLETLYGDPLCLQLQRGGRLGDAVTAMLAAPALPALLMRLGGAAAEAALAVVRLCWRHGVPVTHAAAAAALSPLLAALREGSAELLLSVAAVAAAPAASCAVENAGETDFSAEHRARLDLGSPRDDDTVRGGSSGGPAPRALVNLGHLGVASVARAPPPADAAACKTAWLLRLVATLDDALSLGRGTAAAQPRALVSAHPRHGLAFVMRQQGQQVLRRAQTTVVADVDVVAAGARLSHDDHSGGDGSRNSYPMGGEGGGGPARRLAAAAVRQSAIAVDALLHGGGADGDGSPSPSSSRQSASPSQPPLPSPLLAACITALLEEGQLAAALGVHYRASALARRAGGDGCAPAGRPALLALLDAACRAGLALDALSLFSEVCATAAAAAAASPPPAPPVDALVAAAVVRCAARLMGDLTAAATRTRATLRGALMRDVGGFFDSSSYGRPVPARPTELDAALAVATLIDEDAAGAPSPFACEWHTGRRIAGAATGAYDMPPAAPLDVVLWASSPDSTYGDGDGWSDGASHHLARPAVPAATLSHGVPDNAASAVWAGRRKPSLLACILPNGGVLGVESLPVAAFAVEPRTFAASPTGRLIARYLQQHVGAGGGTGSLQRRSPAQRAWAFRTAALRLAGDLAEDVAEVLGTAQAAATLAARSGAEADAGASAGAADAAAAATVELHAAMAEVARASGSPATSLRHLVVASAAAPTATASRMGGAADEATARLFSSSIAALCAPVPHVYTHVRNWLRFDASPDEADAHAARARVAAAASSSAPDAARSVTADVRDAGDAAADVLGRAARVVRAYDRLVADADGTRGDGAALTASRRVPERANSGRATAASAAAAAVTPPAPAAAGASSWAAEATVLGEDAGYGPPEPTASPRLRAAQRHAERALSEHPVHWLGAALESYKEMRARGLRPTPQALQALLAACGRRMDARALAPLYRDMRALGVLPLGGRGRGPAA